MPHYVSPKDLVESLPVDKGDVVLIASDFMRIGWEAVRVGVQFDVNNFIDLLQDKVSSKGTILFPTYNWDFCQGITFDYWKTKSRTGTLSQIALKRSDFIRTRHPIYSFAVWGKDAKLLYDMDDRNSFVGNTPFAYLHKKENSKMITIDVTLSNSLTFVHYVEEVNNVPYRVLKQFYGKYIDEKHCESDRKYSMYVRDLEINGIVDVSGLEELMEIKDLVQISNIQFVEIRSVSFLDVYKIVEGDIKFNQARNIVRLESH